MSSIATTTQRAPGSSPRNRLKSFEVKGLFGELDYHIPLHLDERVTAIIAPNGSGKTLCLRLIHALFAKRWTVFTEVPFRSIIFIFENGETVSVGKIDKTSDDENSSHLSIQLEINASDGLPLVTWRPLAPDKAGRVDLERFLPFLTRRGPSQYSHDYTGEVYTISEVLEAFSEHIPAAVQASLFGDEPKSLSVIINSTDCHLIETQRLLVFQDDVDLPYRYGRARPSSTLAISKKAESLKQIIGRELAAYAALSQSLDRSFPRRVIADHAADRSDTLEARLHDLDERRRKLTDAGILDSEEEPPVSLPEGPMSPEIRRVLSVYADDTRSKLDSLALLLEKIELFRQLINQRFANKSISVSKSNGFEVTAKHGLVPLNKLSSGEQHQLVLFFELLFELRDNALILIDEPELSLHVAWQKKFIPDLNRIISLNEFDVVLATHSPQLIGRWTNIVVDLGAVDDE